MSNKAIGNLLKDLGVMAGYKEPDRDTAHEKGICVRCGEQALPRCRTPLGIKEYSISGLCEECWDDIFKEPEE